MYVYVCVLFVFIAAIILLLRRDGYNLLVLQNAEVCGKTPGQEREPKLLRLTGLLNNSKGSL